MYQLFMETEQYFFKPWVADNKQHKKCHVQFKYKKIDLLPKF